MNLSGSLCFGPFEEDLDVGPKESPSFFLEVGEHGEGGRGAAFEDGAIPPRAISPSMWSRRERSRRISFIITKGSQGEQPRALTSSRSTTCL